MTYGNEYTNCDGTCTYCVPGCSRYQVTVCIICDEMIQEGHNGCWPHEDIADELAQLRVSYRQWPCGCQPFSSDPAEYCELHRLEIGSLEQQIIATHDHLKKLRKLYEAQSLQNR